MIALNGCGHGFFYGNISRLFGTAGKLFGLTPAYRVSLAESAACFYAIGLCFGGGMEQNTAPPNVATLSFEDALAELEEIVRRLESGAAQLDEAISAYERGAALKRHCEAKLQEAQARVEKIVVGSGGTIKSEPSQLD